MYAAVIKKLNTHPSSISQMSCLGMIDLILTMQLFLLETLKPKAVFHKWWKNGCAHRFSSVRSSYLLNMTQELKVRPNKS